MHGGHSFDAFLLQLRAKDKVAIQRLVDVCNPILLRIARPRLHKAGLSKLLDPEDIAQEVFARFFHRVVEQRDLASWRELLKLLATIALNLIRDEKRRAGRLRRGSGQPAKEHPHLEVIASSDQDPGYDMEVEEQMQEIHQLMSDEESNLVWARILGKTWSRIARDFGQSPNRLRMRYSRILARVKEESNTGTGRKPPRTRE